MNEKMIELTKALIDTIMENDPVATITANRLAGEYQMATGCFIKASEFETALKDLENEPKNYYH